MGHRAPVLWILVPWILGLVAGRFAPAGTMGGVALGGAVVLLLVASWGVWRGDARGDRAWASALAGAVALTAAVYFQWREGRLTVWEHLPPREAELVVRVERLFAGAAAGDSVSGIGVIVAAPPVVRETEGARVYFSLRGERQAVSPTAEWRVRGVLAAHPRRPDGGFDGYLAGAGVQFKLRRGALLAEVRPAGAVARTLARVAGRMEATLGLGIGHRPDLQAVHLAMMLGRKGELTAEQRMQFMQSGTMHLFAISGLHVGVIWAALEALLLVARVPRRVAIAAGLAAVLAYVEATGGEPSARRAWAMMAFVFAGRIFNWPYNPLAGIAAAALAMLVWSPFELFGAGFQLSFGVVAALLLYGTVLQERWRRRFALWRHTPVPDLRWWHRAGQTLAGWTIDAAALGVAATVASLPMTIDLFGTCTAGSWAVNLVLIPLSSLAIIAGVAALLAGLVGAAPVAMFFNHAAILVIAAMEGLVAEAVGWPGMFWPAAFRAPWLGAVALGSLLALLLAGYAWRWHRRRAPLWLPLGLFALVLIGAVRHGAAPNPTLPAAAPPAIARRP